MRKVVPHDFWYRPDVCRDLQRFDLRSALAKITILPGWTQKQLADVLDYSRPTLNKIVNGARPLGLDEALRIVRILGIPPFLIGVGAAEGASFVEFRQSADIDSLVKKIRESTTKFAALERERGGNPVATALARELSATAPTVRQLGSPVVVAAFAELSALTGYAHYDAQQHQLASHYYGVALQAAHESGAGVLVGQIRALMSMKATWLDRPNEAVAHCITALEMLPGMPGAVRAMILIRQARAEALRGDRSQVHHLLAASKDAGGLTSTVNGPIAYWSEMERLGNAGIAYKDIREFDLAEQHLLDAIAMSSQADSRDAILYLGMLSRLYIKTDRVEDAIIAARRILNSRVVSSRAKKQLDLFLVKTSNLDALALKEIRSEIRDTFKASQASR